MGSSPPLVSVIIPTFNAERFIAEAITSIRQQGHTPLEIIVVDDRSTDNTTSLVSRLGKDIVLVRLENNSGPAAARNQGIRRASGEIIAFLDADDLWPVEKLSVQIPYLMKVATLDIVMGQPQVYCLPNVQGPELQFTRSIETVGHVQLGSAIFRRTVFDRVGGFNESFRFAEDHDWFLRAREQGIHIMLLNQITLHYRWHGQNMMVDIQSAKDAFFRAVKHSLDRRRLPDGSVRMLPPWHIYHQEDFYP